jgi:protein-S-isoprenylcysteine O-methyltransferase Ste14
MVVGLATLVLTHALFSNAPTVIASQGAAVLLMLWARATFGSRSFHATADPTAGGLVTTGPYRFVRHPIYTAVVLFTLAGVSVHRSATSLGLAALVVIGAIGRMLLEERFLGQQYREYDAYAARTARMIPFVFAIALCPALAAISLHAVAPQDIVSPARTLSRIPVLDDPAQLFQRIALRCFVDLQSQHHVVVQPDTGVLLDDQHRG